MKTVKILIMILLFVTFWLSKEASTQSTKIQAGEIPSNAQLFDPETTDEFDVFDRMQWPGQKYIDEHKVSESYNNSYVAELKSDSVMWVRKFLKDTWIPADFNGKLTPVRGALFGFDGFIVRYSMKDYWIQIFVGPVFGTFTIKSNKGLLLKTLDEKERFAFDIFKAFFNEIRETKYNEVVEIRSANWKIVRKSKSVHGSQKHSAYWLNGWASFWTDGKTANFTFRKIGAKHDHSLGPSGLFTTKKWFSIQKGKEPWKMKLKFKKKQK